MGDEFTQLESLVGLYLGCLYGDLRGILYLGGYGEQCSMIYVVEVLGHLLAKSRALDTRLVGQWCQCEQAPSSRLGIRVRPSTSHSTAVLVFLFHILSSLTPGAYSFPLLATGPILFQSLGCVLSYHKR